MGTRFLTVGGGTNTEGEKTGTNPKVLDWNGGIAVGLWSLKYV